MLGLTPQNSVQFPFHLFKACSPLFLFPQLTSITDNSAQRGLWHRELHHSPDSVVGCSRHELLPQLPQLPHRYTPPGITRAPWQPPMGGLEVTMSKQQNPSSDETKCQHPPFLSELFALTQLTNIKKSHGQNWIPHNPV